jgi:hypothetical protein
MISLRRPKRASVPHWGPVSCYDLLRGYALLALRRSLS